MTLTKLLTEEEVDGRVKIGEPRKVTYVSYEFINEVAKSRTRIAAIESQAPKRAMSFRIIRDYTVSPGREGMEVQYFED